MGESRLIFNVQSDVHLDIHVIGGDAVIEGYEGEEILIVGEDVHLKEQSTTHVSFFANGDCKLRVPQDATLKLNNIGGDARISDINSEVELDNVGGDVQIRNVQSVRLDNVGGDAQLKRIEGDVEIENVGGDADLRQIAGDVTIASVGGDVLLRTIGGDAKIDNINGDLILETPLQARNDHEFDTVDGDVVIKVSPDANVRFILPVGTDRSIKLRNATIQTEDDEEVIILAEGDGTVKIDHVDGSVLLHGAEFDGAELEGLEDLEELVGDFMPESDEIEEAMRTAESARLQWEQMRERAHRDAEKLAERARKSAERATERAAEKMRRDAERMQREAERAAERARNRGRSGFNFSFDFGKDKFKNKIRIPVSPIPPIPPIPPMPPRAPAGMRAAAPITEPVTDEERMMILRMVEGKQISVEEAERLFAALEGRDQQQKE